MGARVTSRDVSTGIVDGFGASDDSEFPGGDEERTHGGKYFSAYNTPTEGVAEQGGDPGEGATIREGGESFYPGGSKNIGGSYPRTKTSLRAAATKVAVGAGFSPAKDQLTANPPTMLTGGVNPITPRTETDMISLDLKSLQPRTYFPSPQENNIDGVPEEKAQDKDGTNTVLGTGGGVDSTSVEFYEKVESTVDGRLTLPRSEISRDHYISANNHGEPTSP